MDEASVKPRSQIGILPLFFDKAASLTMMKYTNYKKCTEFPSPAQEAIIGNAQPLYATCLTCVCRRAMLKLNAHQLRMIFVYGLDNQACAFLPRGTANRGQMSGKYNTLASRGQMSDTYAVWPLEVI